MADAIRVRDFFDARAKAVVFVGDCLDFLTEIPSNSIQLVITSPPYNIGKEYEKRSRIEEYLRQQKAVISSCHRILKPTGSICWQVGNYVDNGSIIPLDSLLFPVFSALGLKMRNRIVWHFEHGLHCSRRFSGRYETIMWFTKSENYSFNLDPVRVPQKYPGKKYFKGPKTGQYSCNPLGKNPGDVWQIPNVKNNHVEKTEHPCQFPVELVERILLATTNEGDWVLDPFLGAGTTVVAAVRNGRRGAGAEVSKDYAKIAHERIVLAGNGSLPVRPRNQPVYDPAHAGKNLLTAPWLVSKRPKDPASAKTQSSLFHFSTERKSGTR